MLPSVESGYFQFVSDVVTQRRKCRRHFRRQGGHFRRYRGRLDSKPGSGRSHRRRSSRRRISRSIDGGGGRGRRRSRERIFELRLDKLRTHRRRRCHRRRIRYRRRRHRRRRRIRCSRSRCAHDIRRRRGDSGRCGFRSNVRPILAP